jgi:hypothetical protein
VLAARAQFPHLKLWYNGIEFQDEFTDFRSLARSLADVDPEWGIVEEM